MVKKETFSQWLKRNKISDFGSPFSFYDYYEAYKAGIDRDPITGHFPDTFKLPGHPTFSVESKYYKPGMKAIKWNELERAVPTSLADVLLKSIL